MRNKWYMLFKALFGPWLHVLNRPEIEGGENIPDEGAAILASNHQAVMDSFYLPLMVKRQLTFPAKKEYFTAPGLVGWMQKFFFTSVGQIPVDRTAADAGDATLQAARTVFDRDDLFGIYPEGTRSPDGRLYKGRTGMARIAMATGEKVIPVAMINTRAANPIGTWVPRPAKVKIRIGKPIDPHAWAVEKGLDPTSREVSRAFTDHVMHTLAHLVGEPYVDMYASEVKDSLAAGHGYPEGAEPGGRLERTFD
ncbi:1-acyl-sn-glycerol-3-phosphate acyltransferase [Corynebacterium yudongzhengii]|uniref:1-acyl-sn-glycerol-3-phosphate acyltransferase n=1 Tax=Corynebacterium yudongzhengii TaxID=2080740 RepID=A0A2U1T7A7_9CORY|nr:lysophospholipid acyltransferase family protein [Corynebacterium yudongzhengii]AWB81552.1 1-acyl-sn-glycerol-3-phosphate acyltransferase [Corynebacterium yudongzhengii]PWC01877.1 1-acyl-sn-glycerol-3-phosphate acyltransferase [Corynebacterium yudongzhengii]